MSVAEREVGAAGDQRREQVLRAALDVIVERGFAETRITDVAVRAQVSPALVVYYFKTKDGLLTEAMRLGEESWYAAVANRLREQDTAIGQLQEIVRMTCFADDEAGFPEPWSLWLDLWAQAAHDPQVAAVRQEFDSHWRSTISDLVRRGQQTREFRAVDPDDFAFAFSALLDGFAVQFALQDRAVEPERAFAWSMRFAAENLGFTWTGRQKNSAKGRSPKSKRGVSPSG
ncbi:MAG TPA: TetR family transcriptional regulator C-terminal domain-containing protein [Acidimicrobiales bacterium]|nr:TetR family transcriptional regulator C-terminal domain-containing protein [Acidimicrobiales bacterium]